jgi:4-amino-4-deoxy-L-arabinose transferase-like glycosyltransferase
MRNGMDFIRVFFLQQQFGRFTSSALQHVQPFWFYVPALLVLLFPWFPILAVPVIALPKDLRRDPRVRMLAAVVVFGFVFFSASVNKLYGYLMPLLPAVFALLGLGLARARKIGFVLLPSLMLLSLLPAIAGLAPRVMATHTEGLIIGAVPILACLTVAVILGICLVRFAPRYVFAATAGLAGIGFVLFQLLTFPEFDRLASARPLWNTNHPQCAPVVPRDILYGLYYYSGRELSPCPVLDPAPTRVVR